MVKIPIRMKSWLPSLLLTHGESASSAEGKEADADDMSGPKVVVVVVARAPLARRRRRRGGAWLRLADVVAGSRAAAGREEESVGLWSWCRVERPVSAASIIPPLSLSLTHAHLFPRAPVRSLRWTHLTLYPPHLDIFRHRVSADLIRNWILWCLRVKLWYRFLNLCEVLDYFWEASRWCVDWYFGSCTDFVVVPS